MNVRSIILHPLALLVMHLLTVSVALFALLHTEHVVPACVMVVLAAIVPPVLFIVYKVRWRFVVCLLSILLITIPSLLQGTYWMFAYWAFHGRIG